jgi:pSer/pThr/pTyr-binding forkhead associated (FHA) protein
MAVENATLIKRPGKAFILRAKSDGKEIPLHGEMLVGREFECAISLSSGHISRYHAKINVASSGVYLEDLHSTNGTFVNGIRIKGRVRLSLGDEIGFDDVLFRLASSASGDEPDTALSPQHSLNDGTRLAHKPAPQPPIRPSIAAMAEQPNQDSIKKADEVELDNPLSSKKALAEAPDFERQLQARFNELDALMGAASADPALDKPTPQPDTSVIAAGQSSPIAAVTPPDSEPIAQTTAEITPASSQQPAKEKSKTPPSSKHQPFVDAEQTQRLTTDELNKLVERHRNDDDLNVGSGPRFVVATAPLRGKLFKLTDIPVGSTVQMGRDPRAGIYLNDKTISTDHARLSRTEDGFILSATHAKNGILINGVSSNRTHLSHNDKILMGRTEVLFKTDDGDGSSSARVTQDDLYLNNGQSRRYSIIVTVVALVVLIAAIAATST